MKISAIRRLQFSCGHRVYNHESKCANIHGHNYIVFLYVEGPQLDSLGRVVDFGVMKELFGTWIDEKWDHGMLFWRRDRDLATLYVEERLNRMKHFVCDFNPTAEEMAKFLLLVVGPLLLTGTEIQLVKVVLWETENCFAEVCLEQ